MHNGRTCRIAKELVKKLPRAAHSIAGSKCERECKEKHSNKFIIENQAQGSGRVDHGDNSPPPWGYPPWYAREGSDKVKVSEIFGVTNFFCLTQKKVKILFFQNRLLKHVLGVWDLSYHSTTSFSSDSPPTPTGKASKTAQIRCKISQFLPKNRAFPPKKVDYS